ncbi:transcriptional regulatory protein sir2b (Sir2b) [Plasmodium ovale curtisi]|uniref:Transcriptional regulatory protein sir2b (Sir2b) n=1 Tax=Plasmodium ovale curtisi TaxID=864141 RepID=A0A1A8WK75_PLAOA|nr:transcriptional regulatory protein sir2b (Sir2b) [Plasmodium ovale curtisi]
MSPTKIISLEDFNVYSSDAHKENTSNFIFYDLYMNEDISLYKIQLNKTLINKEIINNSHHNKNISNYDRSLLKRENFQQISSKEKDNNINNTILSEGQHFDINKEAPIDICTNEAKETISNNENLNISNKTSLKNELPFTNYMNNGNCTSPNKITNSQSNNDDIMLDSNASNKQASNVNIIIPNCEESDIKNNHNKKSNEVQIENASNTENNINDKNGGEHYSQLLFYPRLLINNKYKHGELVHKIPKYIKPQKIYTPYKKLSRNKKYSNTLQKYRSEIWENNYHEFVNNIDKEHIVDSTLYKELRYFPFWLLNYVNDLFECV